MVEISTSILSVKKENVIKTIYNLETAGTDYFHIDVMDGKFVENVRILWVFRKHYKCTYGDTFNGWRYRELYRQLYYI